MKEEKEKNNYSELLRYPVITVCIVAGLYFISLFVGIDFGQVSKISTEGIEFREKQAEASNQNIVLLSDKITNIENLLAKIPDEIFLAENVLMGTENGISHTPLDTVSETIASLSYINANKDTFLKGKKGFIYLGMYDASMQVWSNNLPIRFAESKEVINEKPEKIALRRYETSTDIMLRSQQDINSTPIGALPRHSPILLSRIEKDGDNHYWGVIEVEK